MKKLLTKTNLLVASGLILLAVIAVLTMNFANGTTDVVDSEASNKSKVVTAKPKEAPSKEDEKEESKEEEKEKDEKAVEEAKNTPVTVPDGKDTKEVKVDPAPKDKGQNDNNTNTNKDNDTNNGNPTTSPSEEVVDPGPGTAQNPVELEIVEVDVQ